MKPTHQIYVGLGLTALLAAFSCIMAGYAAYVTHFTIQALEPKGNDALKLQVVFDQKIGESVCAFIVIVCQIMVFRSLRRLGIEK